MIWLWTFLEELGQKQGNGVLYSDSQSAIHLAKNSVYHTRTKHIQVRYHFIRLALEDGVLVLEKILGSLNTIDMLMKTVLIEKLKLYATLARLLPEVWEVAYCYKWRDDEWFVSKWEIIGVIEPNCREKEPKPKTQRRGARSPGESGKPPDWSVLAEKFVPRRQLKGAETLEITQEPWLRPWCRNARKCPKIGN